MRAFEPGLFGAERFRLRAGFVADDVGEEPDDGVDDDERGEGAVGEDEVADAEFLFDEVFADAFVDAFVVAADEDDAVEGGEFAGLGLVKFFPAGGEEDDASRLGRFGLDVLRRRRSVRT